MANCCCTSYIIRGPKENVARLKAILLSIRDPENPKDMDPWAGYFFHAIGKDPNQWLDNCGWIPNYESAFTLSEDGTELRFWVESKWSRIENLAPVIAEAFDVEVWFLEEELGCAIFRTNDEEHTVFPEYVILDGDDIGMDYVTPEEARTRVEEILAERGCLPDGYDRMTLEEIGAYIYGNLDDIWMHVAEAA